MDTSKLKKMAQYIRRQLMNFIEAKIEFILDVNSIERRESKTAIEALEGLINEIGKEQVVEKVAYTWFNRFCALRYMEVNHYSKINVISPVLGQFQPEVLAEAKMGYFDENVVSKQNIEKIKGLLNNSITSNDPQRDVYKILIVSYCNYYHKQMPFLFEKINDYTELLMPEDLLSGNSVLAYIRETLTPDICKNVEVIGWLYQYYISEAKEILDYELKNKKNRKVQKEDIPVKTQLFTPKWIVQYMVENSVGKLWLESHPDNKLQSQFKYYLESAEQEKDVKVKLEELKNKDLKPQDIKVLDPACGSGHILVTAFSVLFEIYKSIGYQENEIPELILKNNLYGLDICDRAAQLSQFAVMMKAREYDRNIFNKVKDLHICSIKDTNWIDVWVEKELLQGVKDEKYAKEQIDLLKNTFRDAKEYGSILDVKGIDFDFWDERLTFIRNLAQQQNNTPKIKGRLPYTLKQARIMQQHYECVISNPPYLGDSFFNIKLNDYTKQNYPNSKGDLCVVFMEKAISFLKNNGYSAMINQQSWMFIPSFLELREEFLNNYIFSSMVHMGVGAFGADFGTTAFVTQKKYINNYKGVYISLREERTLEEKEKAFFKCKNKYIVNNKFFTFIPEKRIAYWLGKNWENIFKKNKLLNEYVVPKAGIVTGKDEYFVSLWHEVENLKIEFNPTDSIYSEYHPFQKGGKARKYYGNNTHVIKLKKLWDNNYTTSSVRRGDPDFYFKKGICWSQIGMNGDKTFRLINKTTCGTASPTIFVIDSSYTNYYLGLLNSKIAATLFPVFNPTINLHVTNVCSIPAILNIDKTNLNKIKDIVEQNIQISKDDWDSFETSWDFEQHPLLRFSNRNKGLVDYKNIHKVEPITAGDKVQDCFNKWKEYKQEQFNKLKANEEELNRLFIEIYGLQDEMTPEVEDKDITVALADELRDIKSLLSYAVGCMFGRYSLDKKGLIFAGGEFNKDNYKTFKADDDAIIPILSEHYFSDDITERFKKFIKIAFGDKYYEENLEYIASVLGKKNNETADDTIRNYFLKDFYNDHVKMYQKRPIYWLFSSKNGNFNALIYLHRYNRDTVNRILNNYLREYRGKLEQSIHNGKQLLTGSASDKDKSKAQKEIEIAQKIVNEVTDYERDILYPLATERKEIDLDDGVKVNYLKFGKALKDIGLKAKK